MSSRMALENANFYILLALAEGPKHGLGIQQQIIGDGVGLYVRSTTIYAAIRVLVRGGLVEAVGDGAGYRKAYRLTERGRRRLELESRTLSRATQLAQERLGWR